MASRADVRQYQFPPYPRTCVRSFISGLLSREASGARLKRRSINFRMETVSYSVLSIAPRCTNGETMIVGTRTPTPQPSLRTGGTT